MNEARASNGTLNRITKELRVHAPFSLFGALMGIAIMAVMLLARVPPEGLKPAFTSLHALHVLLSAVVTTGLYRRYRSNVAYALLIGLIGAIGIATISDILFPHHGATLVLRATGADAGHMHLHLAIIDHWYVIIPAAFIGVAIGVKWPFTKVSHAGHVLLSVWASLFYIIAYSSPEVAWLPRLPLVLGVLFIAVWVPCCVSDIVFPMLFVKDEDAGEESGCGKH